MEQGADLKGKAANRHRLVFGHRGERGDGPGAARSASVVINYSKSAKEAEAVAAAVKKTGVKVVDCSRAMWRSRRGLRWKLAQAARDAFGRIDIFWSTTPARRNSPDTAISTR